MLWKVLLGVLIGASLGGALGYLGKCTTGACPLTSNPITSGIFGALAGLLIALPSTSCAPAKQQGHRSAHVVRIGSVDEFEQKVLNQADKPVLVDFYADWCGPCRKMSPEIEKLADEVSDWAVVAKVNVDKHQELARRYGVQGIPSLKVFKAGEVVAERTGVTPKERLKQLLKEAAADAEQTTEGA